MGQTTFPLGSLKALTVFVTFGACFLEAEPVFCAPSGWLRNAPEESIKVEEGKAAKEEGVRQWCGYWVCIPRSSQAEQSLRAPPISRESKEPGFRGVRPQTWAEDWKRAETAAHSPLCACTRL